MSDPFATPAEARSPARRFRGRLPAAVTLWTANDVDGRPAGLTMSSTIVVEGQPARVLGVLDDESSLWETVRAAGRFVVTPLRKTDGQLADMFAGLMPAPGGKEIELRISTMPTAFGEKLVMRIFAPEVLVRDFAELGFSPEDRERWERLIREPHGVILVTGPTGSG